MFPPPVASMIVFWSAKEIAFRLEIAVRIPVISIAVPVVFPDEMVLVVPDCPELKIRGVNVSEASN